MEDGHGERLVRLPFLWHMEEQRWMHLNKFIANSGPTNDCDGVFVKLSVAADGKSYTVQIGADGKTRKFKTRG